VSIKLTERKISKETVRKAALIIAEGLRRRKALKEAKVSTFPLGLKLKRY
jgi:hypothetical protein